MKKKPLTLNPYWWKKILVTLFIMVIPVSLLYLWKDWLPHDTILGGAIIIAWLHIGTGIFRMDQQKDYRCSGCYATVYRDTERCFQCGALLSDMNIRTEEKAIRISSEHEKCRWKLIPIIFVICFILVALFPKLITCSIIWSEFGESQTNIQGNWWILVGVVVFLFSYTMSFFIEKALFIDRNKVKS